MYLKTLTCKGFKSFADRSVLNFEPGITAIIGPNGSGKSNVLDAVLWVLGERNARNLRGQAMEDVIFAGSSTRRHVGMAEVNLVLDNSDGTLPVDYSEVSITRRMYRSGESEYLINGTVCRRMDVLDVLHDSGLGTGTHSIISQGHLDQVLQSHPEDRRALIEEAAGVLKHKQRKARSERKLEKMDQHLLRIRDITGEIERQLKPLERKAKRAISYKQLSGELADVALDLAVDDLRQLQRSWEAAGAAEREAQELLAQRQEEAKQADAEVERLQTSLQQQTAGAGSANEGLYRVNRSAEQIEHVVELLREKRRSSLRFAEEKRMQLESSRLRLAELRESLGAAQAAFEEANQEKGQAKERLAAIEAERDQAQRAFSELRTAIGKDEQRLSQIERDAERLRAAQAKAADALSSSLADSKLLRAQTEDAAKRMELGQARMSELAEQERAAQEELERVSAAEDACRAKAGEALDRVDGVRAGLEEQRVEHSRLAAQVAALEQAQATEQSRNKVLSWVLERREEFGSTSRLMELVDIPADAVGVVERLLASAVDALLVSDADAAAAGAYRAADSGEAGSVSFLSASVEASAASLPTGIAGQRLVDLLGIQDGYRDTVELLLGDVVLCDTAREARECAKQLGAHPGAWRVASKDGYYADSRGLQSFAKTEEGSVGALERHRSLEQARKQLAAAKKAFEQAESELAAAEGELRELQRESLEHTSARAQAKGRCESLADQVREAAAELDRQKAAAEELSRRQEQNQSLLEEMQPNRDRLDAELEALLAEQASTRERVEELREQLAPLRRQSGQLGEQHTEARLKLGALSERESYTRRMFEGSQGDIARLEQQISQLEREAARGSSFEQAEDITQRLTAIRATVTGRIQAAEQQMEEYRRGQESLHAQVDAKRRAALELRGGIDGLLERLSDVRVNKGRLEVQVEAAIATITDECGVAVERALERAELENRELAEEQAASLRRRIANLGTINPDAASEYDSLKERYDYLTGQVDDMLAARRALAKIVQVIDARMKDDFVNTFKQVDENFQRIFEELFPGGSAHLSLVDEADPENSGVEVHAQPRGKRIAKMSLMSGGEKSLTALALLFAVYATRSTPFYILDEVEAALDDTNLRRLCSFIDALRDRTQLIMITHQRRTMEMADVLYGVSMQSDGVTRLLSQKLDRTQGVQEG